MISLRIKDRATPYLKQVYGQEINRVIRNLSTAADFILGKFQEATSPTPNYSLKQLRAMGHPYGIRGPQNIGSREAPVMLIRRRSPIPHVPEWLINQQTGQLNRALTVFPINVTAGSVSIQIGVKRGTPAEKYAAFVILGRGTSKMIGRNFMMESVMGNLQTVRKLMLRTRVRKGAAWKIKTGAPWRD